MKQQNTLTTVMNRTFLLIPLLLLLLSCRHDAAMVNPTAGFLLSISHQVDSKPLLFDSLAYKNAAGEKYSISRLQYYLSDIRFYAQGKMLFHTDTILYVDAAQSASLRWVNIPVAHYDSISYLIGIDSTHNFHDKLWPTMQNVAMEWPQTMGGGYHFLKLEGHWQDVNSFTGFAAHLGTNPYLVHGNLSCSLDAKAGNVLKINFVMNVNEWFTHPFVFSFNADGVYTMGNAKLMQKLADNGGDVFSIIP